MFRTPIFRKLIHTYKKKLWGFPFIIRVGWHNPIRPMNSKPQKKIEQHFQDGRSMKMAPDAGGGYLTISPWYPHDIPMISPWYPHGSWFYSTNFCLLNHQLNLKPSINCSSSFSGLLLYCLSLSLSLCIYIYMYMSRISLWLLNRLSISHYPPVN